MARVHPDSITDCPATGKKKALLIAVKDNGVKGFRKLSRAHDDAREVQRLLIEVFGYQAKDIVLMIDDKSTLPELWPTRTGIKKQIQRFVQGVSAGDHLFFYYSGHGHQVPCHHHTEPDGLDEEIFTCNRKEIIDNELRQWLVEPLPPGCRLFALWDSCHSHTILGGLVASDLDHYSCNEPRSEQRIRQRREFGSQSTFRLVLPKRLWRNGPTPIRRNAFIVSHELRGRPATRASVSITAVSAGNSPPLSKYIPFFMDIRRVLSPTSWFRCNGKCSLPTEGDIERAHVISLSACKDNESAFDDAYKGTFTRFFIDHLRAKPKSTLRELLLSIRQRVDEITAARQEWDMERGLISRRSTFASGRRIKTEWTPQVIRRLNTEVNADALEDLLPLAPPGAQEEDEDKYSQKPSYSSHYRLDLDELVDI